MKCAEARARLQDLHDAGRLPGEELAAHLAECGGCAGFQAFLAGLGGEAREALDAASAGMPRPDYPSLLARDGEERGKAAVPSRRIRLAFASAAAVLVAGIGITAGVGAWVVDRDRRSVASNVNSFVEELFAEPLLADAGPPVDVGGSGFREWLEDPQASFLP